MSVIKFKNNLRKIIFDRGITILELSEQADVTRQRIYTYLDLSNAVTPNSSTLERLADTLGVTMDDLYRGDV